jgi:FKBP-type peptidyl-prolyl cis-trans isomerase FkpA
MRIVTMTLAIGLLLLGSCSKDSACVNKPAADEDAVLRKYNEDHGIVAQKHSSGLYYQIIDPGSAKKPLATSRVYVKYKGNKLDDVVFDQQTNPGATGFYLTQLVQAWQIAIPMIGNGGKILITSPSSLGYGCLGSPNKSDSTKNIDPNSPLFFEIELEEFR